MTLAYFGLRAVKYVDLPNLFYFRCIAFSIGLTLISQMFESMVFYSSSNRCFPLLFTHTLYLYINRCLHLKYRLIFLRVMKVFDKPVGESNTERQVKISAGISKEST